MADIAINGSTYSNSTSDSSGTKKGDSLTQADFLSLLIQQMRSQDPTQPMDSSQMVSQLAQISQVDATQKLQTSFDTLSTALQGNQLMQASGLVGRDVTVPSSAGKLVNGSMDGAINVTTDNQIATVQIVDAAGNTVRTINLGTPDVGLANFHWDGLDDAGQPVADGTYGIKAQVGTTAVQPYITGKVSSVGMAGDQGAYLQVDGFGGVLLGQVARIN
ncbi:MULTISPECIES: flagellar hook assembly protein FlgD [Dyella]|uniref:Basal-body rod modification protein FlgD n=2 Tax=Dyella TaxID=231454 RepID=A0A4R0YJZ7_9GAMM|nr:MULTISPECIES: flagellar hook capping FlgD N-terminal domain-containing protein [Dyella]TBR37182.1 flagellar hook capping protein [Dyella terrae]TCI07728.1 flagellar hook capping protein [Dyella soli]